MRMREIDYGAGLAALVPTIPSSLHPCLLESGLAAGGLGRYSLLGWSPSVVFSAFGKEFRVVSGGAERVGQGDPWAELARLHRARAQPAVEHAFPCFSGALGYASYESGLGWERVIPRCPDDVGLPDLWFGFYDGLLIADERERRMWVVADADPEQASEAVLERLASEVNAWRARPRPAPVDDHWLGVPPVANMGYGDYVKALERIRDYIASGDIYQANFSQRFTASLGPDGAWGVYARLRRRSAAPFAMYLDCGYGRLASSSPERFLRVRGRSIATRPIKGTRPRGRTPEEDAALRRELVSSVKDRAELLMIVDLERNDLGRVCDPGSVRVSDLYQLEEYPTVLHLVAGVEGRLRAGEDVFSAIRATFPGGSITGAPKVRALQVINELEPSRRGVYTGAMGYLGFRGTSELNIGIRTVQCAGGRAHFHAGSGIVWDSSPADEYAETLAKAKAMSLAVTGHLPGGGA